MICASIHLVRRKGALIVAISQTEQHQAIAHSGLEPLAHVRAMRWVESVRGEARGDGEGREQMAASVVTVI